MYSAVPDHFLSVPNSFAEKVRSFVTPEMRAQVMDHRDPAAHGAALVDVLESKISIKGGLRAVYEHPDSSVVFNQRNDLIVLTAESPDVLIGNDGTLNLVCDQYAHLARTVLAPALSDRITRSSIIHCRDRDSDTHVGVRFSVHGAKHTTNGVPRWYRGKQWRFTKEAVDTGLLWNMRRIGIAVHNNAWPRSLPYFPFMEFPCNGGHAMVGVCLVIEGNFALGKVIVCLPNSTEIVHAVAKIDACLLSGKKYHPDLVRRGICYFRINDRRFSESIQVEPLIEQVVSEVMASLFSKKMEVL